MKTVILLINKYLLEKVATLFLGDVAIAEYIEVVPRQVVGIAAGLFPSYKTTILPEP